MTIVILLGLPLQMPENFIWRRTRLAAAMGKMKSVEALVALGARLIDKDANGLMPIELAERAGLSDAVLFLRRAMSAH